MINLQYCNVKTTHLSNKKWIGNSVCSFILFYFCIFSPADHEALNCCLFSLYLNPALSKSKDEMVNLMLFPSTVESSEYSSRLTCD